jgi:PAS domain S-box-containing protein
MGWVTNEITTLTEVFDQMVKMVQERERILSESQARYQALIDSLPGPAFLSDGTGAMHFISPQIEDLLGYSPEEWTDGDGRLWIQLVHPDHWPQVEAMLRQPRPMPFSDIIEVPMLHKDGHYHWIESRFSPYTPYQDTYITAGIILDIESRQQDRAQLEAYTEELSAAYRKLQETQQQLVQSARLASAGELATGVAHEINNPLAAVHGLAQVLISKLSQEDEGYEPLNQIIRNTDRISRIVHQLRGYTIETADRTLVNLNDTAEGALLLLQTQLARNKITVHKEYAPDPPLTYGVPHQLEQVVVNLITNARDAIAEKKAAGEITLRTWHQPAEGQVCLSVSDTGVGIPTENLQELFTAFFTTKSPGRGTGLGLSISHGIIEEHEGQILVSSQTGSGSTFTIVLPERKQP